ncbi:MAG: response regulator [Vulcanimicrobiota bacterium]
MCILVVDDCDLTTRIIEFNLTRAGYNALVAHSISEAMEHLTTVPHIKLVILDIMLTESNGLELLKKLKETPEWENIPVIICTGIADADIVKKAIRLGCNNYHVKPLNPRLLLSQISEILAKERPVIYSDKQLISMFGLDDEAYGAILRGFYELLNDTITLLEEQFKVDTFVLKRENLQKLLESSRIMGAWRIEGLLTRIQAYSGKKRPAESLKLEYKALMREMKIVLKSIPLV